MQLPVRKALMVFTCLLLPALTALAKNDGDQDGITLKKRNAPLEKIFHEIEKQSGYQFFYKVSMVSKFKNVDIDVKKATLEETLAVILKNQPFTYEIINKTIVLKQKEEEVATFGPPDPLADISGRVVNDANEPLGGVSVRIKGTERGTTTDENGLFTLPNVNTTGIILVFSYIGYEEQELKLNAATDVSVQLKRSAQNMQDVTVSVSTGYQTLLKGRATGSFSHIKGEDMNKVAAVDYRQKLEGLLPGVSVGRSNNITIRGQGTFSANRAPLVVIDGVPIEGADYKLNPDDIDQITVLKDAAAASIWGVRSANGVIVIQTKRGNRTGKTSVSYNSFTSVEEKVSLDDLHLLASSKYATGELNRYMSFGTGLLQPYSFVTEIGKIYNDLKVDLDTSKAVSRVNALGGFDNKRQIEDLFYRNELMTNHTIGIKTGNTNASHYFSVNYTGTQSFQEGDDQDKLNFTSNSDFTLSKRIKLQFGTRGNYFNSRINAENAAGIKPYIRILDEDGNYVNEHRDVAQDYKELLQENGWKNWDFNRLQEQRNNDHTFQSHTYAANLRFIVEPLKGFTYTLQANYEKGFQKEKNLRNEKSYYTRHLVNQFSENADLNSPDILDYHLPKNGGILYQADYESNTYDIRNQLEYAATFRDFQLTMLAGHEFYHYGASSNSNLLFGYNPQTLVHIDVDRAALKEGITGFNAVQDGTYFLQPFSGNGEQIERYLSYFSTFSLNYKNRYDFFASARLDKTNLLVNADRYRNNPSWSAGAKWNISKERFFHFPIFNDLSVKASYGISGNIDKSTAPDITGAASVSRFGVPVLYITNPENKELGWEKSYIFNTGIEFSMWKDRLSGSIEYYHKDGRELLYNVSLDPTTGWTNIKKNAASLLNQGVDININGKLLVVKNFSWMAAVNFSYNYNRVKEVDYTPTQTDILGPGNPLVGKPLNYLAVIPYLGQNASGDPMIKTLKGGDTLGAANLKNFTIDDYIYAGRKDPPYFGSVTNSFQYKNWKLEFFITYKFGHKFLLPTFQNSIGSGAVNEWSDPALTWKAPGDEKTKPYPRLVNGFFTNDVAYIVTHNQTLVDKADIIRLRTLSLEYNCAKLLNRTPFKDGSIRLSAENLWYYAPNKYDLDTDYVIPSTSSGSSSIVFPAQRKLVLYLKLTI
jgi:TonB-linked SusC/RagA family outer membrane protein